ncbi:MAG: carbamoyltransferase HypF [Bacillota bacterium]
MTDARQTLAMLDAPGAPDAAGTDTAACRWLVEGRVQGVGFRPFVYRLARALGVRGFVQNRSGQVVVVGEGPRKMLARFARALLEQAPPLARPRIVSCAEIGMARHDEFAILASEDGDGAGAHLPPDCFCCDDCLRELNDPDERRYRYPFNNCTQCGPRYTLIARLPYDRANTSMAGFAMCAQCRAEYEDPGNRRFHAEPVACPACGPRLVCRMPGAADVPDTADALAACVRQLAAGGIVAVKGVGGYHLLADATDDAVLARLRERKRRPHKPVAVMFPPQGGWLERAVTLDAAARAALFDPVRPIVLAPMRAQSGLSAGIAPGLKELGAMLPYSPLHYLLLQHFGKPLVVTSANLSGEPVLTEAAEVEARLGEVADGFLHHDRPILRPADDSVLRVIAGKARPLRLGRGAAPVEWRLPFALRRPLLATGSQMKNTIALAWQDRAVISPHIGDLGSPRAQAVFEQAIADLQELYGVTAQAIACDAHPGYAGSRWALAAGMPVLKVQHHRAHASALAAEHPEVETWLAFAWDGVGLGDDGTLWGGEGLLGRPGRWTRAATLRPFCLPGGEKAARAPWRSAAGACWEIGHPWRIEQHAAVHHAWRRQLNCPRTSAAGRLFDAAAVLVGLLDEASHEGQGPMWLEAAACGETAAPVPLPLAKNAAGLWQLDWEPLVGALTDATQSAARRAACFHNSLAHGLLAQARAVRRETGVRHVGLCGGVFQNRLLGEQAVSLLEDDGFEVRMPERLPCNDGALSFGQLVEAGSGQC